MISASARLGGAIAIGLSFSTWLSPFQPSDPEGPAAAKAALYTARYPLAVDLYRKELARNPAWSDGYYGLVRALLRSHRPQEAYTAAEDALRNSPNTAGAETAAGMASFRKGNLAEAENHFHAALKLDTRYPGGLAGLASICSTVSKFKTARDLRLLAYRTAPSDPELMQFHANTLSGAQHIAALEKILAIFDPASDDARNLRVHIQADRALGDRKLSRLVSPYQASRIKMLWLYDGPKRIRGAGLRVQINAKQNVTLLLDTGASGIALSLKTAEKAGLELLDTESTQAKGIGDEQPQESQRFIASEIRAGDVAFADFPVSIFRAARSSDADGLIGADVFQRFVMTIDFPKLEIQLEPRPARSTSAEEPEDAPDTPPPGFSRMLRLGNHLAIFTAVNEAKPRLFLLDSGSSSNLIDTDFARETSQVYKDDRIRVQGLQGKVRDTSVANKVSLVFAGFKQDNSDVVALDFDKVSEGLGVGLSGILGLPVVAQLKVSIDYHDGIARFERGR